MGAHPIAPATARGWSEVTRTDLAHGVGPTGPRSRNHRCPLAICLHRHKSALKTAVCRRVRPRHAVLRIRPFASGPGAAGRASVRHLAPPMKRERHHGARHLSFLRGLRWRAGTSAAAEETRTHPRISSSYDSSFGLLAGARRRCSRSWPLTRHSRAGSLAGCAAHSSEDSEPTA